MPAYWTSIDGTKKLVTQLDHYHIQNIIRMLWRKSNLKEDFEKNGITVDLSSKNSCIVYLTIYIGNVERQRRIKKLKDDFVMNGDMANQFNESYAENDYNCYQDFLPEY